MAFLSEAQLETALLTQLAELGFACASDEIIAATIEAGLVKSDESMGKSRKFARYLPFWA